ncbi:MAG: DUF6502 family protein [Thiohalomonadales bacterium]
METLKKTLSQAVIRMLNPIVRMLLHYNVSHSEFTELAKRSYVNVAFKYFSIAKRKKTNSRVSVITGLSRQEVVRISEISSDEEPETKGPLNRARRVIGGWLSDADFLDEDNEPKILPLRGDAISFNELAVRYSGGITARAILDELIRVGSVEKIDKEHVKLKHHGFVPNDSDIEVLKVISKNVRDHIDAAIHNLIEKEDLRFERQLTYVDMPDSIIDEFKKLSHKKSSVLLVELNKWLAEKKKNMKLEKDESLSRVGIGIYYIKSDEHEDV